MLFYAMSRVYIHLTTSHRGRCETTSPPRRPLLSMVLRLHVLLGNKYNNSKIPASLEVLTGASITFTFTPTHHSSSILQSAGRTYVEEDHLSGKD